MTVSSSSPARTGLGRTWVAAAGIAGAGMGSALALSLVLVLMLDLPGIGLWDELVLAGTVASAGFGVDGTLAVGYLDEGTDVDLAAHLGGFPLVVSLVGLGLSAYLLRRRLRDADAVREGLVMALRTALVTAAALLLLALVLRTDLSGLWGHSSHLEDLDVGLGARRTTAPLLGFLTTLAVLAAACLLRRDWLGPRLARVHDVAAAPIRGLAALLLLLPAAGIVAYAALLTGHLPEDLLSELEAGTGDGGLGGSRRVALGVLGVGNAGLAFLGIGSGGRLGASVEAGAERDLDLGYVGDFLRLPVDLSGRDAADGSWWGRLATVHDHTGMWGLWLAVPVTLLVLGAAAWVVTSAARRSSLTFLPVSVWCATMLVALPLLARSASVHAGARLDARYADGWGGTDGGQLSADVYAGLAPVDALLIAVVGVLVTVAVAIGRGLHTRPRP